MDSFLPFIIATNSPISTFESPLSLTIDANTKNWSNLPPNILFGLIKYLDFLTDIPHLRSVCHSWRSALPLSLLPSLKTAFKELPSLNLTHYNLNNINTKPVFLRSSHFYLLSNDDFNNNDNTYNPWLVKFIQADVRKFHLLNPVNFDRYFLTTPPLNAEMSLLGTKSLKLSSPFTLVIGGEHALDIRKGKIVSKKVVGGWNLQTYIPFNVLVLLEKEFGGGLLFIRYGDLEWINIDNTCNTRLDVVDVVFYKNEFYAFEVFTWQVGIIDTNYEFGGSPSMEFIVAPELLNVGVLKTDVMGIYFVPTKDHLYVVFEVIEHGANKLVVFVLDEQEWEWTSVSDIGNEVFFIGSDVSFAVSAEHLPRWKAGTICLFNRSCWKYYNRYVKASGDDMPVGAECMDAITYVKYERLFWLFDMDDQEKGIVPFEELDDKEVYTRLFFPPPPWMKWHCASCDDVEVQLHNLKITGNDDDDDGHGSGNVVGNEAEEVLEEVP